MGVSSGNNRIFFFNPFISNTVIYTMKNSSFLSASLLFVALAFVACKKDTAQSLEEQVTGTWASQSVRIDDANASAFFSSSLDLQNNQSFNLRVTSTNPFTGQTTTTDNTGNWRTNESAQTVTLNFDNAPTQEWKVVDITQNSMSAQYTDADGHEYDITFAKQ